MNNTENMTWEAEFDEKFTHEELTDFRGTDFIRVANVEHVGDVSSKLLPQIKDFIRTKLDEAFRAGEKHGYEVAAGDRHYD